MKFGLVWFSVVIFVATCMAAIIFQEQVSEYYYLIPLGLGVIALGILISDIRSSYKQYKQNKKK